MGLFVRRGGRWWVPAVAALVLVGAFAGVALSDDQSSSSGLAGTPEASNEPNGIDTFIDHLAAELGVSRETLTSAAVNAADATLDDMVGAGKLTSQQANVIRKGLGRIVADPSRLPKVLRGLRDFAKPYAALFAEVRRAVAAAVAQELHVNEGSLMGLARSGRLREAMKRAGVTAADLGQVARSAAAAALDEAVAAGALTQRQAEEAAARAGEIVEDLASGRFLPPGGWNRHLDGARAS